MHPAPPLFQPSRTLSRAFVRFTLSYGRWLWLAALLLALPAGYATFGLYARLSSDIAELLPRKAPSVLAIEELRARMPGLQYLGIVVDAGEAHKVPAAEKFLDALAERIRRYPKSLVRSVKVDANDERRFIESYAPLYADIEDLTTVKERITARRRYELSKKMGSIFDDEGPPPLDFSDINAKYEAKARGIGNLAKGRFSTADPPVSLLLVEVGGFSTGGESAQRLLGRVKTDIAALGGIEAFAPGMKVGFAADVAVSAEEISALAVDLTIASVLVILAVLLVILLYFRWWRSVPAIFAPLVVAALYAFGLATLPPFGVERLNSNTAFLGSIIIGNGINFAILFLARYLEARRRGANLEDGLTEAVWGARLGTLVAALAAGVAYGSLLITQFRGFRQFGAIGGLGMVLCWCATFLLMPPLLAWLDKGGSLPPLPHGGRFMAPLARFVHRHAVLVVGLGALFTLGSLTVLPRLDSSILESDFSRLRRRDTWTEGEGYWGRKMDRLLGRYLSPTVLLTDSPEEAQELGRRVAEAARKPPLDALVSEVRGPSNVLPPDQAAKIEEIDGIRRQLTEATRAAADPQQLERLDQLLGGPIRPARETDLPPSFTVGMREYDGSFGKAVLVFPSLSKANWRNENLDTFTSELRRLASTVPGRPARVAGALPLSADIVASIRRDGPLASALAFAGVLALVLFMFRFTRHTLLVVGSLLCGVLWLFACVYLFGIRINFVNFIAFPITFGIGVDYAVNVMARFAQDGSRDIQGPIVSTGAAVGLCSLTTIIGYSSLLLAKNQGLFLFGLVAVLGELACLVTALALLPGVLLLLERLSPPEQTAGDASDPAQAPEKGKAQRRPATGDHVVENNAPPPR